MLNIARSPVARLPKRAVGNAARTVAGKPKRSARQPAARLTDWGVSRVDTEPSSWVVVDFL